MTHPVDSTIDMQELSTDALIAKADILVEALPYIQEFHNAVLLVKFGGSAMEVPEITRSVLKDIAFLASAGLKPIIVHGGGKAISAELAAQNVPTKFINGLRYTCDKTIKVVDQVLHDKVNTFLVDTLKSYGIDAVQVSGKNILRCQKITTQDQQTGEELDLGYVGKVVNVDTPQLDWILQRNQLPVITPLACDMNGQTYNINADMAACVIAAQLKARKLVFLSDVPGVLKDAHDETSLISTIRIPDIDTLAQLKVISGGMLPKLNSAAQAIAAGVGKVHMIDGRQRHSLLLEIFTNKGIGTQIIQ